MAVLDSVETVIVFDLDDTLYKEVEYQTSGLKEVCRWIESVYGLCLTAALEKLRNTNEPDLLGGLCRIAGLPLTVKESLLWVYRLHQPSISLLPEIADFLSYLQSDFKVAILTDGRSISQRLKLKALGLGQLPAYISEEYGSDKSSPVRFELIMRDLPGSKYFYVGDNPQKDFIVPNGLGWTSVCLRDGGMNIHSQNIDSLAFSQRPKVWINNFNELKELLHGNI